MAEAGKERDKVGRREAVAGSGWGAISLRRDAVVREPS